MGTALGTGPGSLIQLINHQRFGPVPGLFSVMGLSPGCSTSWACPRAVPNLINVILL